MGLAMAGVGLAVLIGPPIGGGLYSLGGHPLPFYVVAGISLVQLVLQYFFVRIAKPLNRNLVEKQVNLSFESPFSESKKYKNEPSDTLLQEYNSEEGIFMQIHAGFSFNPAHFHHHQNHHDMLAPSVHYHIKSPVPSFFDLIKPLATPQIILVFFALLFANGFISMVEFLLPLYLEAKNGYSTGILGIMLLPSTFTYFIFTPLIGAYGGKFGRVKIVFY